jgi:hypothetical protein
MSSIEYDNDKTIRTRIDSIELQSSSKHCPENVPQGNFFYPEPEEHVTGRFLIYAGSIRNNYFFFLNGKRIYEILIWPSGQLYIKKGMIGHDFLCLCAGTSRKCTLLRQS